MIPAGQIVVKIVRTETRKIILLLARTQTESNVGKIKSTYIADGKNKVYSNDTSKDCIYR